MKCQAELVEAKLRSNNPCLIKQKPPNKQGGFFHAGNR
jgi:hypothetical protein